MSDIIINTIIVIGTMIISTMIYKVSKTFINPEQKK